MSKEEDIARIKSNLSICINFYETKEKNRPAHKNSFSDISRWYNTEIYRILLDLAEKNEDKFYRI